MPSCPTAAQGYGWGAHQSLLPQYVTLLAQVETGDEIATGGVPTIFALPEPIWRRCSAPTPICSGASVRCSKGNETAGLTRDELNARTHIVISVINWVRAWMGAMSPTNIHDRQPGG